LKQSSPILKIAIVALLAAATSIATIAQTPASQEQAAAPPTPRSFPAPTNLKVLPKNLTGQQVRDIMEGWEASLGTHCNTCHAADPNNIGPNGRPRLNFADDSKPEKATARLMFGMTEDINKNYVSKVDNGGAPVTCGTCHRGHLGPEPFVAPPEEHGPPPGGQQPLLPR
jgi:cytochrome c553